MAKAQTYYFRRIDAPTGAGATTVDRVGDNGTLQMHYTLNRQGVWATDDKNVFSPIQQTVDLGLGNGDPGFVLAENTSGEVAGVYSNPNLDQSGLFYGTAGNWHLLPDPSSSQRVYVAGISDTGYIATNGGANELIHPDGQITSINMPVGASWAGIVGVSDNGSVVGNYGDANGTPHPFYELLGGQPTVLDVPITPSPNASGYLPVNAWTSSINAAGMIVGDFSDGLQIHGFLYSTKDGSVVQIDVPGANDTGLTGINASGEISGWFDTPGGGGEHGFITDTNNHGSFAGYGTYIGSETEHVLAVPHTG